MSIGIRKFKKTKIGSIPENWQVVKIKNVAETSSGGTPSRNNKEYFKGSTSWVKTGELTNKYLKKTEECISKLAIKNSSAKVFPKGTILVAMYGATIGKMSILNIDASCNQACCSIIPDKSKASTEYIYYALEYRKPLLISMGSGGAQPNISQQIIKVFEIPLPEIVEQEKTAEILSTVDVAIEKTDAIIKETQQLKKGLMDKLFTDGIGHTRFKKTKIGRIPEEWVLEYLTNIVRINPNYKLKVEQEYNFLPMEAVSAKFNGIQRFDKRIYQKQSGSKFKLGDTVFAKITPCTENGKIAFIEKLDDEVGFGSTEFLVFSPDKRKVYPNFLFWLVISHRIHSLAISRMEGTTGRQRVPRDAFRSLLIGLPPIEEQERISFILSEIDSKLENEQNYKSELEQLKKGLLQVLLTGKVRVKV